jgi:hypothetical protein
MTGHSYFLDLFDIFLLDAFSKNLHHRISRSGSGALGVRPSLGPERIRSLSPEVRMSAVQSRYMRGGAPASFKVFGLARSRHRETSFRSMDLLKTDVIFRPTIRLSREKEM